VNDITNQNIALEHLIKKETFDIEDKIQNANSTGKRIEIIEEFLKNNIIQNNENSLNWWD